MSFQLGREVIDIAAQAIEVGVTTEEIDRLVHEVSIISPAVNLKVTQISAITLL